MPRKPKSPLHVAVRATPPLSQRVESSVLSTHFTSHNCVPAWPSGWGALPQRNRSWAPPARPALQVGDLTPQDKGAKTRNSGCVDEMRPGTPYRPLRLLPARLALEIPRWRQAAHQRPSHSARKHKEIPQDEAAEPVGSASASVR